MPKPLKKSTTKTKQKPSSDPISRVKQLQAEHEARVAEANPPWTQEAPDQPPVTFAEQLSAHMKALGAKGGKIGGKRRLETMTEKQRKAVAMKAAAARWAKKRPVQS